MKLPKNPFSSNKVKELSKEEVRKRRKRIEQIQAYGLVGGSLLLVVLLIGIIVLVSTGAFHKKPENESVKQDDRPSPDDAKQPEKTEEQGEASAAEQVAAAAAQKETKEEEVKKDPEEERAERLEKMIEEYLSGMTLEEKVAGLFFVTPEQLVNSGRVISAGGDFSEAISQYPIGGILYTEKNIVDADQFLEMISNMRTYCRYETFMGISDEGGKSSPFITKKLTEDKIPSQTEIAESGGVADAYSAGLAYGTRFRAFGLNVNFAPVTDVTELSNAVTAKRSFGKEAETVASLAKNEMQGMKDQLIQPVVKYFPGYGDVRSDGTSSKTSSTREKEDLEANEFVVYKDLITAGVEMIMVSVVNMPNISKENEPACFSSEIVTDLLRGELEYDGVILTDYMNKNAVSKAYKQDVIAVKAILAGCDMIVSPGDFKQQYQSILDAVSDGTITEKRIDESITRIYRVKYKNLVTNDGM